MRTRYNWVNVPKWVQYQTTDANGDISVYESKPTLCEYAWYPRGGDYFIIGKADPTDWENSLEQRPAADLIRDDIEAIIKMVLQQVEVDPENWGEEIACSVIAERSANLILDALNIEPCE
jgi:hypothetical protein